MRISFWGSLRLSWTDSDLVWVRNHGPALAQLARLAPGADYSACGEILRPGFYTAHWPGAPAKPVVFLSQGNYPLKGMHRLIQALPPVLRRYPDLVVRVAGWPPLDKGPLLRPVIRWMFPYQRYLQDLARRLGVAHAIQYTGPLDEAGMLREMRELRQLAEEYYTRPRSGKYTTADLTAPRINEEKR